MNNFQNNVDRFRRGYLENPGSNEPTFLTFSIDFNFISQLNPTLGLMSSPLFDIYTKNGAYQYLIGRGYEYQADCLLRFIKTLTDISENQPWFFQSLAGLDTLWSASMDMSKPFKGKDKLITIETLESLDLTITYLADMYRQAMYDMFYMRELVPENLRRFQVDIYVSEFRNLIINPNDSADTPDYSFFNNYKTHVHYTCSMCEFDFSKSVPFKDSLTVFKPEMATNRFGIKPLRFIEKNSYDLQRVKKMASAVIGEVKQLQQPTDGVDKGRTALNTFEKDDFNKVSLNDLLYGSRRLSDVYHGIESGEYLNNFLKNNPVTAAITNVTNEIENTINYIKSNVNPPTGTTTILYPDDVNNLKPTTYADIEADRTVVYNSFEATDVNKQKAIDKTVQNADVEKTQTVQQTIDKEVKNSDSEKVFINTPIDKEVKNPISEKVFNIAPIDKNVYNPEHEKVFKKIDIDKTVYNPINEKTFNNESIDKTVYNQDSEKTFTKQEIDKTVYNIDDINNLKAQPYVKPTEPLNPFEKNNDII